MDLIDQQVIDLVTADAELKKHFNSSLKFYLIDGFWHMEQDPYRVTWIDMDDNVCGDFCLDVIANGEKLVILTLVNGGGEVYNAVAFKDSYLSMESFNENTSD